MIHESDVLIIGGGVVGLTAALGLSKAGYSVGLVDAGHLSVDRSKEDLKVYAINQSSKKLFQVLDVWQSIDEQAISPYHHMHVWDAKNGAAIDFDSRMIADNNLGAIIEESAIKEALLQQIEQQNNIQLFANESITRIDTSNEIFISSAQRQWQGKLLMVCDGANSPARAQLKVSLTSWSYHSHAIVAKIETEKAHEQTAWQVFLEHGPLAFLPLKNPHHCSIVWSTSPKQAELLMSMDETSFNQALTKAFSAKLGAARVISQRVQFPLTMRQAKSYAGTNWLLAGDAAHSIHPLAGLGLNLGLADIACLLEKLDDLPNRLYFTKILKAYQRSRKSEAWKVILLMEAMKTLFSHPLNAIQTIRGLGLQLVNQSTPLKRVLIKQAMRL